MNRDEAQRCIELGISALKSNDIDKALRLFQKSLSLFPTEEAERYLRTVLEKKQKIAHSEPKSSSQPKSSPEFNTQAKYTPDQESLCREILKKSDYYDVLGISKTATQDEIKKSYRKLALKLHPDKNHAPSASEAFKKINKSFACLSDEIKKRTYDQTGQEDVHGLDMGGFQANGGDFAEHIFREFFNESFFFPAQGFQRVYRTQRNHGDPRPRTEQQANNRIPLMQLLPILLLIFLSIASSYPGSSEVYSFHYSSHYSVKRITDRLNVEYYLQPSYAKELTYNDRIKLEANVEKTYINYLTQECDNQRRKKNTLVNKAKYYKGSTGRSYQEYADQVDMTACNTLQQLKTR
jgi:DnaJ homolog subfamily B member 12